MKSHKSRELQQGPFRILIISSTFPPDREPGTPRFVCDLATNLAEEFEVMVLAPMARFETSGEIEGVRVKRFRYWPGGGVLGLGGILDTLGRKPIAWVQLPMFLASQFFSLLHVLFFWRPHLVNAHWLLPQGLLASIVFGGRLPLVITSHGGDANALHKKPFTDMKRFALRKADMVLPVTSQSAQTLRAIEESHKSKIIPMGVNLDEIKGIQVGAGNVPRGGCLFVGRLAAKKGLRDLLDAISILYASDALPTDFVLNIVGDGPLREELEALAIGLPVNFLGPLTQIDVFKQMVRAEMLVAPSRTAPDGDREGLPVVLLEAAACGAPIVATSNGGVSDFIVHNRNGLLVEENSPADLAGAIRRLLSSSDLRSKLARQASLDANRYAWAEIASRYSAIFQELIQTYGQDRK